MLNFVSKFKNTSLFQKSYYFKMFLLYSSFTVIVLIFSSIILMHHSNKILAKQINISNKRLLTQVQIFSDKYLIEKINSIISENFIESTRNKSLSDFFSYNNFDNTTILLEAYRSICKSEMNNNIVNSIYIYRKADDILISSNEGLNFNISNPTNPYKQLINLQLINKAMALKEHNMWISPLENIHYSREKPMISFIQSIPLYSIPQDRIGCVIFNIDQQSFFESLNKIYDNNSGSLMIIDSKGRLFANSNLCGLFENINNVNEIDNSDIKQIINNDEGFKISKIKGKNIAISWIKSSLNDWKYISIVPIQTLNKQIFIARQFALLVIGTIIFLSLMGLNLITFRLYKPINILIKNTKNTLSIKQNCSNELAYINNVVTNLATRVNEMKDTIDKNQGIIEYRTCLDILYGNFKNIKKIEKRLELIHKNFIYKQYGIILVEINKKMLTKLPLEQREFVTYKIIDIINYHFSKYKITCISTCYPSNCIATIINFDNYESVVYTIDVLMKALEKELGLEYNIAVSKPNDDLLSLYKVYITTNKFLKYSFIFHYKNIFTYDIIKKFETNNIDFNLNTLKYFETLLKCCKIETLKNEINKIINDIKQNGCSYIYSQNILMQIINLVCKTSHEQSIVNSNLNKNKLLSEFNNISNIDECMQWIFNLINIYNENINIQNNTIDEKFISKITEYISNNINQQISLNIIAEKFNISPSHLSRIFKKGTGINFSQFVKNKKLEKAADLLKSNNNMDVSTIAKQLGYWVPSYFAKLFKEKYGMTPLQYRKKMI